MSPSALLPNRVFGRAETDDAIEQFSNAFLNSLVSCLLIHRLECRLHIDGFRALLLQQTKLLPIVIEIRGRIQHPSKLLTQIKFHGIRLHFPAVRASAAWYSANVIGRLG